MLKKTTQIAEAGVFVHHQLAVQLFLRGHSSTSPEKTGEFPVTPHRKTFAVS